MKKFFGHPAVLLILKTAVTTAMLAGLFYYIDLQEIASSLSHADLPLLALGFLFVVANTGIHFLRWRYLLRLLSKEIGNGEVLTSLLVGFTAGFFTPAQVGEFAGRIASHPDLRKSHIVGMTIIDKMYILAATLLTGIPSLAIFAALFYAEYWNVPLSLLTAVFLAAVAVLFLFPEWTLSLLKFLPEKIRAHKLYDIIGVGESTLKNRQGRMVLFLSLMLYAVIAVQFFIFLNAFEPVSLYDTAVGALSVYFIKAVVLPVSIGDLGVRESASVFFFAKFGVSAPAAFNASLCMFLANVLLPSVAGALLVIKLKTK